MRGEADYGKPAAPDEEKPGGGGSAPAGGTPRSHPGFRGLVGIAAGRTGRAAARRVGSLRSPAVRLAIISGDGISGGLEFDSSTLTAAMPVLPEPEWRARQSAHERRVRAWTDPHQVRLAWGEKHPVYDFLFTYYAYRPAWLRRWHPGPGVVLAGRAAREFLRWPGYREVDGGVTLDSSALPAHRIEFVTWLRGLLGAMQIRPAFFGCYGLHEWAMVYRQSPTEVRHPDWPLRFPPAEIARLLEQSSVCCSHFDAFRFFTAPARALNKLQPTRTDTAQLEQRGCLHANMDLYKWAFKLAPFTPAELVADCFELARDIREVDMRASPYDLSALGFAPIPIETPAGRAEYERWQRIFTTRGEPLRARLIEVCDRLAGPPSRVGQP